MSETCRTKAHLFQPGQRASYGTRVPNSHCSQINQTVGVYHVHTKGQNHLRRLSGECKVFVFLFCFLIYLYVLGNKKMTLRTTYKRCSLFCNHGKKFYMDKNPGALIRFAPCKSEHLFISIPWMIFHCERINTWFLKQLHLKNLIRNSKWLLNQRRRNPTLNIEKFVGAP